MHAVAVRDGRVVERAGDPQIVTFMRSSAKPLQALPLARARADIAERRARDRLRVAPGAPRPARRGAAAARRRAGATEDDLECGADGDPPSRLNHNCSGKHAGMLAHCRAHGWGCAGYRLATHPLQQLLLAEVAAATGLERTQIATGVDGCGVVTFALPLERMALAFARLAAAGGRRGVVRAMRAHPGADRAARARRTRC